MKITTRNDHKEKHQSWEASVSFSCAHGDGLYDFYISVYDSSEKLALEKFKVVLKSMQEELDNIK